MSGPSATQGPITLRLEPTGTSWPILAQDRFTKLDDRARRFRAELGLPTERPLVMAGHQLAFWHCGILAKYLAVVEMMNEHAVAGAWLWVDHDEHEFSTVRVPVLDELGRLLSADWALTPRPADGWPVSACPAFEPAVFTSRHRVSPSAAAGIEQIVRALGVHRSEPTAALQLAGALKALLAPFTPAPVFCFATAIARTTLFKEIVGRMQADPAECVRHYNIAVAAVPQAQLAPLAGDGAHGPELPLWRLAPGTPRARVFASTIGDSPIESLAPRAILMTGLLRVAGCDLFIHGTGGGVYEAVTDRWLGPWLGASLAPFAVATADVLLPLDDNDLLTANEVAEARWTAHRAKHDPGVLHDSRAWEDKKVYLNLIRMHREGGRDPAPIYREMHGMLARYRQSHERELALLGENAEALAKRLARNKIATDRTWAFPFHAPGVQQSLWSRISQEIAGTDF